MKDNHHLIQKKAKRPNEAQSSLDTYFCTKCAQEWPDITRQTAGKIDLNGCPKQP